MAEKKKKPKARFLGIPIVDNRQKIKDRVKSRKKGGPFHPDDFEGTLVGKLSSILPAGQIRQMHKNRKKTAEKIRKLKAEKEKLKAKNEAATAEKKPATTPTKKPATTAKKPATSKATPKKKKKMHAIEKRNREIHGDATIDALKKKHEEFKAKRKAGTHRKKKLTNAEKLKARTGR